MDESFILFQVAGASYAVRSSQVQQVEMLEGITRVPNTPEFVEGVAYVRGQVIPVINLRQRFHFDKIPYDIHSRMIVIHLDNRIVAMAVDSAREFVRLKPGDILPPPDSLVTPNVKYLEGVATVQGRLVLIVNLHELLDFQERAELNQQQALEPGLEPAPDEHETGKKERRTAKKK